MQIVLSRTEISILGENSSGETAFDRNFSYVWKKKQMTPYVARHLPRDAYGKILMASASAPLALACPWEL